jgi:probable F420-dependent oxidoreductase
MQIGVVFPQTEIGSDPGAIRDYAQTAEQLGFKHLVAYDHVLGANPNRPGGWTRGYTFESAFHEPMVLFGYLAGITRTLQLFTEILILPQRQTALVAKQAAAVDVLSGGRLRLGVGVGWNTVEYESLGQDFHSRGRRMEEQIGLLRKLWTQPLVTHEGRFDRIPDAGINPLPVQRPIPIWMGGMSDVVQERTARLADGWFPQQIKPGDEARALFERMRSSVRDAGRDPGAFGIEVRINASDGSPDNWAAAANTYGEIGATHVALNTMGAGFGTPAAHIDALRRFSQAAGTAAPAAGGS